MITNQDRHVCRIPTKHAMSRGQNLSVVNDCCTAINEGLIDIDDTCHHGEFVDPRFLTTHYSLLYNSEKYFFFYVSVVRWRRTFRYSEVNES